MRCRIVVGRDTLTYFLRSEIASRRRAKPCGVNTSKLFSKNAKLQRHSKDFESTTAVAKS